MNTDTEPDALPPFTRAAAAALALDPLTTYAAVRAGAGEGHPLWASLIVQVGLPMAMTIRLLAGLTAITAVVLLIHHRPDVTFRTLRALAIGFVAISLWNLAIAFTAIAIS